MKKRKGLQILKDNVYSAYTGEFREGITDLNTLHNIALKSILRKKNLKMVKDNSYRELTEEEKAKIEEFYRPYATVDTLYHRVYTSRSGRFFAEYIPEDLYACRIERYYTDREAARFLDNKCYYYSFFANIRQPERILMRMGGYWIDPGRRIIPADEAKKIFVNSTDPVVKKAFNSEGGFGVSFPGENDRNVIFDDLLKNNDDIVIQKKIKQHEAYRTLHPESVNTLRIMSLATRKGIIILKAAIRIGSGRSSVDNICNGGFFVGVGKSGVTMDIGAGADGRVLKEHPDLHYALGGIKLPGIDNAVKLVKKAHGIMSHCRIAAWDIAIDEEGEAVLIETNLSMAGIGNIQSCSGPLFGKLTKPILDEVFYKNGVKRHTFDDFANSKTGHLIIDNIKGAATGYYRSGKTRAGLLTDIALKRIDKKAVLPLLSRYPELTSDELRSIHELYDPYVKNVPTIYHRYYKGTSGRFYPEYIPEEMYLCDITRYLNDRDMAFYYDHKCYYGRLFDGIDQPKTVVMRINGIWLDDDYRVISPSAALKYLCKENEAVYKTAQYSEGGAGVAFLSMPKDMPQKEKESLVRTTLKGQKGADVIIQRPLRQCEETKWIHPDSVNTFRIVSLIMDDEVHILQAALRTGVGSSKTDNGRGGGIYIGIDEDNCLKEIGVRENGETYKAHPDSGATFKGTNLECVEKAYELVKKAHPMIAHMRLVSWDVAIDDKGRAVLIECNLTLGSCNCVQMVNGPFFGGFTHRILDEVYGNISRKE
ncbi:MAG: hypothetical protein K6A38_08495 [Lachnospiraceae bacterium]|nr:hypothetical protein [Lachnospiraceae bacterium]